MVKKSLQNFEIEKTEGENLFRIYPFRILMMSVAILLLVGGAQSSDNGLVAEYHFDGDVNDSSGNGNNGTIYGNAAFVDGVKGKALSFDGSNDYVNIPDSSGLDINGSITIEAWIKYYNGYDIQSIISKSSYSQNDAYVFPRFDNTNQFSFWLNNGAGWIDWQVLSVGNVIPYGEWHHVAGTYDGSLMKLYVDGNLTGTKSVSGPISTNSNPLTIGNQPGFSEYFHGIIDEVLIYNRDLSSEEIRQDYEDIDPAHKPSSISFINLTPASGAILTQNYAYINTTVTNAATAFIDWNHSLIGWWRFNNESGENPSFFRDSSSYGNNATCSGVNCPTLTSGKFGNALNFDGMNNYIDAGSGESLNISDVITIEAWINPAIAQEKCYDGISGNYGVMSKVSDPADSVNWSWQLRYGGSAGCYLGFQFNGNPQGSRWITVKQNLTAGQWYHIVGTFNGTDINSYLNGDLTDTNKISTIKGYSNKLIIGSDGWGNYFNGKIDEVRIHRRALSPEEIKASYDAGIYRLYRNFTDLADGSYNYQAYAQNLAGAVNQTETRTLNLHATPPTPISEVIVSIANTTTTQNNTINRSIMVENVNNLAAATVELTYNPNIVNVLNVSEGDLGSVTVNIDNDASKTKISAFSNTGRNGNVTFANVELKAVGSINDMSPLSLTVSVISDQNTAVIPYSIKNGTFTIVSKGDVNEDGQVNVIDALLISQYTVGMRTFTPAQLAAADVNNDGQVTIVDALFIAQYTVGLRQL